MILRLRLSVPFPLKFIVLLPLTSGAEEPIDFNRDIRPILSQSCIMCHGPDEHERKGGSKANGGLRLDTEAGSRMDLGGFAAVVPGHPERSDLIARLLTKDQEEVMPPPKSGKKLQPNQVELLTRWIKEGGNYTKHWSYQVPVRHTPPAGVAPHPVDSFVLERLKKEGLEPQPEADRTTLARRAALDITGLPPSPDMVQAFVQDAAPEAYERYVDKLLASPAYGEHWGREWLDLARYADSAGYADDPLRTIWPYRDYVIQSYNANKPFDQFTLEQIAGDLLPQPSDEQLIATAFHRNTMTNSEGGTNDEEFRSAAVVDRVNTTMSVWMGTTMACAQCHTHKYDPLTHAEYFQIYAFLNNTADNDQKDESPLHTFYAPEDAARKRQLEQEIALAAAAFTKPTPAQEQAAEVWAADHAQPSGLLPLRPTEMKAIAKQPITLALTPAGSIRVQGAADKVTYDLQVPITAETTLWGLQLQALPEDELPGKGPGYAGGNFVISGIKAWVQAPGESNEQPITFSKASADYQQPGFPAEDVLAAANAKSAQGWGIGGATGLAHTLLLSLEQPVPLRVGGRLRVSIEHESKHAKHTLGHFQLAMANTSTAGHRYPLPAALAALASLSPEQRSPEQRQQLQQHFFATTAPDFSQARQHLAQLKQQLSKVPTNKVPVMKDLKQKRKTNIHLRGNYLALGDQVQEGVPAAFHQLPADAPRNRLTLARWLMAPENPLTARVIANRYWETLFGIGLVRKSEEFGSQGELPSHPELLDWLATELVRTGWDLKKFVKLLVTTSSYKQSSKVLPALLERDPENRLLARGPRFRMTAEMVRDQALAVSGLLSPKMHGPSVRPERPNMGLSAAFGGGLDWTTSTGDDRFRRALYTEWRRTSPYPSLATFDAPNREVCNLRRSRSNTPLQAFVTLNDPVFVEAAQALARQLVTLPTDEERFAMAYQRVLSRPPTAAETARLQTLRLETQATYAATPQAALDMATKPIGPLPAGGDAVLLATWTTIASVILNLDETLMKR